MRTSRQLRVATAATALTLLTLPLTPGFANPRTAVAGTQTYYFHGGANDDAARVQRTPTATFSTTAPTGTTARTQTSEPLLVASGPSDPAFTYWTAPFTGEVSGAMHVSLFWSSPNVGAQAVGTPIDINIYADVDVAANTGTLIGTKSVDVTVGSEPSLTEADVVVSGSVFRNLLIQAAPSTLDTGQANIVSYDAAATPSSFSVTIVGPPVTPPAPTGMFTHNLRLPTPAGMVPGTGCCFVQKNGEPSVRAANDGSVYVVSPIGGPVGGCNFWSVNPGGGSAVYRGRSDNNAGGGDCDLATSAAVSPLPAGGGKDVISANSLQAVEVTGANITATSSHDGGKTFVSNPEGQPIVAVDRAWNAAGAASNPLEFYMVYRQLPGTSDMIVLHSIDGGLTFVPVRGTPVLRAGHVGNIVVSSDGQSLYVVYTNDTSESSVRLAVSHDAGTTWTQRVIHDSGGTKNYGNIFPSIALDPDNNHLYATYTDGKNIYFASAAADAGPWTEQLVPTLDGTRINVFPWIASSKPGRADLVWYGTPDATQSVTSKWNVYFARYTNSADPALSKVSDSPNHTGFICFTGTGCNGTVGTPGDRSLLDFIQISDGPDGRSHVVWTADNPGNANEPTAIMYAEELPETSTDVPETAVSLLLPLAAAVLFAGAWLVLRRRQQAQSAG